MDNELIDKFPNLPDRTMWPASLVAFMDSGNYMVLAHEEDQVVLLSLTSDDLFQVRPGRTIQARIAISLKTGEVVRPTPGTNLNRWQAEVLGRAELYEQHRRQQQNLPLNLAEWDFGGVRYGIPKK